MNSIEKTFKTNKPGFRDIMELRNNEIEYWRALYQPVTGAELSPDFRKTGPFHIFKMPDVNILAFNRVLIRPDDLINDPVSYLDGIIRYYRSSEVPRFFLQTNDAIDSPSFREMLYEKGFQHYNDWTRLHRSAKRPTGRSSSSLKTRRIGKNKARTYAEIIVRSFDFPENLIPQFSSTVGWPGYLHYLVYENDMVIAAGALFIRDGYASMAMAGTLPEHRGKGAQQELLRERIIQAQRAGCRWITAETAKETPEKKVVSYRNMLNSGFSVTCHRPNFIYYP